MTKYLILLSFAFILMACSNKTEEDGIISKLPNQPSIDTIKLFYKNDSVRVSGGIFSDDPFPDTAIFFSPTIDQFAFEKDQRVINIYYDKQFTILATRTILDKRTKSSHYRRYDRKGTLRMETFEKNKNKSWTDKAWHSNGIPKFKWFYENGVHELDSSYYFSGKLEQITLYHNSLIMKETSFYKNGKISSEMFWQIANKNKTNIYDNHSPRFKIEYDSIDGRPTLFYMQDKLIEDKDEYGNEFAVGVSIPISVDSVELKKRK